MRIGIVAPSTPIARATADRVAAIGAELGAELYFHPQCFATHNHFAGADEARADALVEAANDPALDAIWFARGGYGSCRIAEAALARLGTAARAKTWLGYSDAGFLLAGLYKAGIGEVAHGPMPNDILREGGEEAVRRALLWLTRRASETLEPGLDGRPAAAFNITVLGHLLGTALEPDLAGHVLLLEDVAEYSYRTDRALFHITGSAATRRVAGIRLGRCSMIPDNYPAFGESEEEIARHWCARAGIPFLGPADIGHDGANKVVPYGASRR